MKGRNNGTLKRARWLASAGYRTTLQYLAAMCLMVVDQTDLLPHGNPGTMSRRELETLRPTNPSVGIMLESSSPRLYEAGGPHEFGAQQTPAGSIAYHGVGRGTGIPLSLLVY